MASCGGAGGISSDGLADAFVAFVPFQIVGTFGVALFLAADVLSLSPRHAYAKVYDGIALLNLSDEWVSVAIEYERTLKSPAKYQKIREAIESERRINAILYLVPTDELFSSLMHEGTGISGNCEL